MILENRIPAAFANLLREIGPLNRVHNGDDTAKAIESLKRFCATNLPGEVNVYEYTPGRTYNFWIVPRRWKVRHFEVRGPGGVICDHSSHPLALAPYSRSVMATLSRSELLAHAVTRPDLAQSYAFQFRHMYRHWLEGWAISLPHEVVETMPEGQYRVDIDVEFTDEPMQVFEYVAAGRRNESVVLCGHIDHPGMINDSLSGCFASLQAIAELEKSQPDYTYRVWMLPEIIASAVHLDAHPDIRRDIRFAMCPNMTGHDAPFALCLSKSQTSLLDRAMRLSVAEGQEEYKIGAFHKYPDCGDEISFDTVGYNIPATTLSRVGEMFKTYHTSADSTEQFLLPEWQARHQSSVATLVRGLSYLDRNRSLTPRFAGNPCLSNPELDLYLQPSNESNRKIKEGLRKTLDGGEIDLRNFMEFFLGALAQERTTLIEIADAANVSFDFVAEYAERFRQKGLITMEAVDRIHVRSVVSTTSLSRAQLI